MVDLIEKNLCCGCTACVHSCPKNCISMEFDEKGFLYPKVDNEKCVKCGLCDSVCKESIKKRDDTRLSAYGAYNTNEQVRISSSSGGVFSIMANSVLDNGGVVFGVAMSDDMYNAEHILIESKSEVCRIRGSKYIQSRLNDTFIRIKGELESGREVLFSGTPCQVSGLKAFLKVDYDNLICVDIICHGVPSERIWKKYCKEIEEKRHGKIVNANFRSKKINWAVFGTEITLNNNKTLYNSKYLDPFCRLFLHNYTLRPSCYNCQNKGIVRKSDITIADFWGVKEIAPQLSDEKGTSLLIVQTQKGNELLERIKESLFICETDLSNAINNNKAALNPVNKPSDLELFWKSVDSYTVKELAERFNPISLKKRIKCVLMKTPLYSLRKRRRLF